jgi:hypothetical protein
MVVSGLLGVVGHVLPISEPSKSACQLSSPSRVLYSVVSISSVSIEFHAAKFGMSLFHANFMICISSNFFDPRRERRSSAISFAAEKSRSHGTEEAGIGRTSSAMRARVGYS